MLEEIRNGLEIGVGIGDIFRDPPSLHSAVRQDLGGGHDLAALKSLFDDFRLQADPGLRRDIRLALFGHGGQCRYGVACDDFSAATVTLFQNDLVEIGGDFSGLPVHAGDRDVSTVRSKGCTACKGEAGGKNCGTQKYFHFVPSGRGVRRPGR